MSKHVARIPLVVGTAGAVAQAATEYSASTNFRMTDNNASLLLTTTAGSITITQQASMNNQEWYDAYDAVGNLLGTVATAQGVTTGKWIAFNPVMAPYTRFKVVEGNVAATTVTIELMLQEDLT